MRSRRNILTAHKASRVYEVLAHLHHAYVDVRLTAALRGECVVPIIQRSASDDRRHAGTDL